ncbi:4-hydroxy-tetrahydrodipicolinate synthase [Ruminococcaceae bacterium OttesenSCG-928-I18]|nr:4-hydroxy-tetrahydrodipicolinate synthase [Ruminococcaceae bacterium OttesenSCG-928-I18]
MGKKQLFSGAGVAIVTPMHPDGSVNYEVFEDLIEFQIANGIDAIIVCGTTGEASSLSDEEHLDTIEHCVKTVNKRVPVIAGTGSNDTMHGLELSKEASIRGADGLLQVTPYYNKTNQSGLVSHFTKIVDAVGLPTILYNVPSRTGMTIKADTYRALADHPLIVATKEASGDISHITNVAAICKDDLAIYSGNDDQIVPILSLGGIGIISVMANVIPQEVHEICALYLAGRVQESLEMQLQYLPLNNALFCDVNPIPVKEAVNLMGHAAGQCRLPLGQLGDASRERVQAEMKKQGLLA